MSLPKSIRFLLLGTVGLFGLILVLLVIVSFFRIPISLEGQKGLIESIATSTIERQISIDGKIQVTTSLWPVFIIEDVHIKNPENFEDGDFARLQSARIEVGIIRLLMGKVRVKEFKVSGLELSLRADDKGQVNWVFGDRKPGLEEPEEKPAALPEKQTPELTSDSLIVDKLSLSNIGVSFLKPGMEKPIEFRIDKCSGSAQPGKAFEVILEGSTLEEPYEVSIRAASLQELLEENKSWVEIETKIAKAQLNFSGNVDLAEINRNLKVKLKFKGEGLQNFNRLLGLDLPPIPTYGLNGSLAARKGLIELTDLKLQVSNSVLTGSMKVDDTGSTPEAAITLQSPVFQINDFVFDEWSPFQDDEEEMEVAE
ncbi:MAG: AsmA family protein, partial [Desulfobulbales bacterium]